MSQWIDVSVCFTHMWTLRKKICDSIVHRKQDVHNSDFFFFFSESHTCRWTYVYVPLDTAMHYASSHVPVITTRIECAHPKIACTLMQVYLWFSAVYQRFFSVSLPLSDTHIHTSWLQILLLHLIPLSVSFPLNQYYSLSCVQWKQFPYNVVAYKLNLEWCHFRSHVLLWKRKRLTETYWSLSIIFSEYFWKHWVELNIDTTQNQSFNNKKDAGLCVYLVLCVY